MSRQLSGKATVTGSERAGSAVARQAGAQIKKTVLELGGSDPFIVMPSADFDQAVTTAVRARIINNGQSCIAAKRFIIAAPIADEFQRRFVRGLEALGLEALKVGDPMDPATDIGPLATAAIRAGLHDQVQQSVAVGARLLTGGKLLPGRGYFYPPTALADVPRPRPLIARNCSGRSRLSSGPGTPPMPSVSPMTRASGWAPACGPVTTASATASSRRSNPDWSS